MSEQRSGIARYDQVDQQYLDKRQLKKSAGWVLLWALGVGAVISGDFAGWNSGLLQGGFWGLTIATILMAGMYVCMVFTIAELSAALPHAGGFFSFTRNAFGPTGGFICGLTDTIEYVITPAVIVYYISGYMSSLVGGDVGAYPWNQMPDWGWWIAFYALFVSINIWGVELTLKFGLVVTGLALAVLVFFYGAAVFSGSFDSDLLFNIKPDEGQSARGLPHGWGGVFKALPFAIWFYLAIEQLPLAAEETHDVVRDMPKALIWGIVTLLGLSLFTLVLNSGVGGGAAEIGSSDAPLEEGFKAIFGAGMAHRALVLIALTGLIASFHTIIYAYGRVLFALSRAGYIPRVLSLTGENRTPYVALIAGAVVGLACTFALKFSEPEEQGRSSDATVPSVSSAEDTQEVAASDQFVTAIFDEGEFQRSIVGAALLNMAVFGAVISYAMVMASFIKLRITRPDLERPYRSPLGIPGAAVGGILAVIALVATFMDEDYRPGVIGVAVFVGVGILYFLVYSRHHLVAQAPEEEEALISSAEKELA